MNFRARLSLGLLLVSAMLIGCGHARIVHREGQPKPHATMMQSIAAPLPRAAPEPVPRDGFHVVQAGETLYGISFRFGLRYQDVASWNQLDDASLIHVGQRLRLRQPEGVLASVPSTTPTPIVRAPPPSPTPPPAASVVAPAHPVVAMSSGSPAWRWPTSGQVVARFVAGDQTEQGIDIAGNAGQSVNAAADGVVVYSGAGLVGYGELIIIKHNDQWLSAYGHNRRRLVAEGAQIKAGDVIAEMGRTGAARDELHFEIRLNGKPVDPLQYLPAK